MWMLAAGCSAPNAKPPPIANVATPEVTAARSLDSRESPPALVDKALAVLATGKPDAVIASIATIDQMRGHIECGPDERRRLPADVRWAMVTQLQHGEASAAAEAWFGETTDPETCEYDREPMVHHGLGEDDTDNCRVVRPYDEQVIDLRCWSESRNEELRLKLSFYRLDGSWVLGFLQYGRGFNN